MPPCTVAPAHRCPPTTSRRNHSADPSPKPPMLSGNRRHVAITAGQQRGYAAPKGGVVLGNGQVPARERRPGARARRVEGQQHRTPTGGAVRGRWQRARYRQPTATAQLPPALPGPLVLGQSAVQLTRAAGRGTRGTSQQAGRSGSRQARPAGRGGRPRGHGLVPARNCVAPCG